MFSFVLLLEGILQWKISVMLWENSHVMVGLLETKWFYFCSMMERSLRYIPAPCARQQPYGSFQSAGPPGIRPGFRPRRSSQASGLPSRQAVLSASVIMAV